MNKDMTEQEYTNFLNTINTLPKKEYEIIRRGVLQLNDDKKALFKEIDRLNNIIEELEKLLEQMILDTKKPTVLNNSEKMAIRVAIQHIQNKIKELKEDKQ